MTKDGIPEDMLQRIDRITFYLHSSEIDDFMFILDFGDIGLAAEKLKENITSAVEMMHIQLDQDGNELFLITNKNCKINGYGESWMMAM